MLKSQGLCHGGGAPLFLANFPNGNGLLNDFRLPRRPLMVRAALLRRSCDGVVRRSRCCDGDAQTSSVALILRVASRRDALNEEPTSFPPGDSNFNSWPTVLGHPPGPVIKYAHTVKKREGLIWTVWSHSKTSASPSSPRSARWACVWFVGRRWVVCVGDGGSRASRRLLHHPPWRRLLHPSDLHPLAHPPTSSSLSLRRSASARC